MVADGSAYPWSSAAYHFSGKEDKTVMADYLHDSVFSYSEFFYEQKRTGDIEAIREAAQQGKAWGRVVVPRKRGRSKKEDKLGATPFFLWR